MAGSEAEVTEFLVGVCDALTQLPVERLETEKAILRTEAAGRGRGLHAQVAAWRYGAQGHGVVGFPEWGLGRLGPEEVLEWARAWFTRQNAVLWVAGEQVPAGIRLPLPEGVRRPVPVGRCVLPERPVYVSAGAGQVVFDAVVRRSTEGRCWPDCWSGNCFAACARRAVTPARRRRGVIDVLEQFRVGRIVAEDLATVRVQAEAALTGAEADVTRLPAYAADLLTGWPARGTEELCAELREVTPDLVHAAAVEALSAALLVVPDGLRADWAGFVEAPRRSPAVVAGTRYSSQAGGDAGLVIGREGCPLVDVSGARTVRYEECVALLRWPDGARQLIGADGLTVPIDPSLVEIDDSALTAIDVAVSPSVVISMPARAIPRPVAAPARPAPSRPRKSGVRKVVLLALAAVLGLFTAFATLGLAGESTADPGPWIVDGVAWCAAVAFAVLARRR